MEETKLRTLVAALEREFILKPDRPRAVLFEQGPRRLQAQWILPEEQAAKDPLQLCLLRLDRPQSPLATRTLQGLQGVEPFPVEDLSCRYQVELGIVRAGRWQSLARSNAIWLPPPQAKPQFPRAQTTLRPAAGGDGCLLPAAALTAEPMPPPEIPTGEEPPRFPSPCTDLILTDEEPPEHLPRFPFFEPNGISSS